MSPTCCTSFGEDSPNQSEYVRPQVSPDTHPKIGVHFDPQVPGGYQYDLVNAEVLLTRAKVKDGRIVLATGATYRLLVIPQDIASMTPQLAAKVRELVEAGMAVLGPKPTHPMTLAGKADNDSAFRAAVDAVWGDGKAARKVGAGRVFPGGSVGDALTALKVAPRPECRTATPDGQIAWLHRKAGPTHIYFVANRQRRAERVTCTLPRRQRSAVAVGRGDRQRHPRPRCSRPSATRPSGRATDRLGSEERGPLRRYDRRTRPCREGAVEQLHHLALAKPDIDLRLMPDESVEGRINETGKHYLIPARSGRDIHGAKTAIAGLALGRTALS
ncbi:alpha-L-rhamnosidase domain-containing protein [Ditylenchus destructor]|uniref:Alpha-L-rhamnosidase domain-containing protein n=1 Tax=Ditylenchus destructor TaxID=166010 RepID=A0AAD4MEH3_9BILA|nr:alpha-L-rhamnosidase domain-containing protein [Ditylenchus destructor]